MLFKQLPEDVWEDHLVPFLDPMSWMALTHVDTTWRRILSTLRVVWHWQTQHDYIEPSNCPSPCTRRMAYLSVVDICPFLWSWRGPVSDVRSLHQILDQLHRPLVDLASHLGRSRRPVEGQLPPPLRVSSMQWEPGMFIPGYESCVVALPRMRECHPQMCRVSCQNYHGQRVECEYGSEDPWKEFWFEHHKVEEPEQNVFEVEECMCPYEEWLHNESPGQDDTQRAVHQLAVQQSLQNLGCQPYPMSHCLDEAQLLYMTVGEDMLDWHFLLGDDGDLHGVRLMYTNGFVYFVGVGYEYQPEDTFNFARSMYCMERYLKWRIWRECALTLTQYIRRFNQGLCEAIEGVVTQGAFEDRLLELYQWHYDVMHAYDPALVTIDVEFLDKAEYRCFWLLLHAQMRRVGMRNRRTYLSHLLPPLEDMLSSRTSQQPHSGSNSCDRLLALEMEHMLLLSSFLLEIKEKMVFGGPDGGLIQEEPVTSVTDHLTHRIHLQQAISLLAFCPGWELEKSLTYGTWGPLDCPPRMRPSQSHRSKRHRDWLAIHSEHSV